MSRNVIIGVDLGGRLIIKKEAYEASAYHRPSEPWDVLSSHTLPDRSLPVGGKTVESPSLASLVVTITVTDYVIS